MAMHRMTFALAAALCLGSRAVAAPFDGQWSVTWKCQRQPGDESAPCAYGQDDSFQLYLRASGENICGFHFASMQRGNHIDEGDQLDGKPTITGIVRGDVADLHWRSAWGGQGTATIRLRGNEIDWTIDDSSGRSALPRHEILIRQRAGASQFESRLLAAVPAADCKFSHGKP